MYIYIIIIFYVFKISVDGKRLCFQTLPKLNTQQELKERPPSPPIPYLLRPIPYLLPPFSHSSELHSPPVHTV